MNGISKLLTIEREIVIHWEIDEKDKTFQTKIEVDRNGVTKMVFKGFEHAFLSINDSCEDDLRM